MCGIAGLVGRGFSRDQIERMTDVLAHRGPDDRGVLSDDGVLLGHRRLSILDPSAAGHQPMSFAGCTIVYNGEIYNFRELREGLPGPFASGSDTEVLLHLYAEHGERCVELLHGMFAFAIWDRPRRRLFAARDRLGIKPFFYRVTPDGVAFASEIKSLLQLGRPRIDATALRDYFSYKYIPTPKSIYEGIRKLPPAHTLSVGVGSGEDGPREAELTIEPYWQPESRCAITREEDGLAVLEPLLAEVVEAHTVADVPIGVFLSGGIDSTAVVANLDRPRTFTLGFDVSAHDESQAAREVAEHFGAEHREEVMRGVDLGEALEAMPRIYDEPFGDHGAWPVVMVSRLARREVKVALSGEGGDELFAGYHWYEKFPRHRSRPSIRILARLLPAVSFAGRSLQRRAAVGVERYAMFLGPFTPRQKRALLAPGLQEPGYDDLWHFRRYWREELEPMKRLQWADLHTYLIDDMMPKLDRASMSVSLEARPPFVDHRLVEFALSLDGALLRDGPKGKLLVRRHLAGRVPEGTLTRRKIGFSMPVRRWVERRPQLLDDALARLADRRILRSARRYRFNNEQAWSLLVLDRWLKQSGAET